MNELVKHKDGRWENPLNLDNHNGQLANKTKFQHYNEMSRWPTFQVDGQLFADLSEGVRLGSRTTLAPVVDLTDIADQVANNQGISDQQLPKLYHIWLIPRLLLVETSLYLVSRKGY
jgi:hypothetical protein